MVRKSGRHAGCRRSGRRALVNSGLIRVCSGRADQTLAFVSRSPWFHVKPAEPRLGARSVCSPYTYMQGPRRLCPCATFRDRAHASTRQSRASPSRVTRTGMRWADHPRRAPVRLPYKVGARRCVKPMVRTASVRRRDGKACRGRCSSLSRLPPVAVPPSRSALLAGVSAGLLAFTRRCRFHVKHTEIPYCAWYGTLATAQRRMSQGDV